MKVNIYIINLMKSLKGKGKSSVIMEAVRSETDKVQIQYEMACENITKNRLELLSVVLALRKMKTPSDITVYTDAESVSVSINKGFLAKWISAGWRTSKGDDVKNKDLWVEIASNMRIHDIDFILAKRTDFSCLQLSTLKNREIESEKGLNRARL